MVLEKGCDVMIVNRVHLVAIVTAAVLLMSSIPVSASSGDVVNAGGGVTSSVPITIDGNYEDWADKPHANIPPGGDINNGFHSGSILLDETYVYLHIRLSPTANTHFNGNNYQFIADNKELYIQAERSDYTIVEGDIPLVIYRRNGYQIIDDAAGYLTLSSGQPDEWEIRIPLTAFPGAVKNISEITFYSQNLGNYILSTKDTPTLPYVIAGGGLVFAVTGYQISRRKRKKA